MPTIRPVLSVFFKLSLCTGFVTAPILQASAADAKMEVLQRWKIGGEGGWDYLTLDSGSQRLFITRANRVDVISTETGKLLGSVPTAQGVHGVALAKELNRGYASNGRSNSVTAFALDTLKVIQEAKIPGGNPDAILYEPTGKHVFTFNGMSKNVTVLDATSLAVVATIPVPDKPEFAVDDGHGQIFVNIESDPGQMVAIDTQKLTVTSTWPLPGCNSPSGLALDGSHHRLFSVCDGKVMAVTDANSGKQVARVAIGEHPDAAAYDENRALVLSSNGEGTLSVAHQDSADRYTVVDTVQTQKGARTMALDEKTGKIYLATADFGAAPAATTDQPHPRPSLVPNSFVVVVVGTR